MTIEPGLLVSTGVILLGLATAWGSIFAQLKNINARLDKMNGSIARNAERIQDNAVDISGMQGERRGRGG